MLDTAGAHCLPGRGNRLRGAELVYADHHVRVVLARLRLAVGDVVKLELIHRQSWATRAELRREVLEFVEVFLQPAPSSFALNYISPAEYERQIRPSTAAQAA